MNTGSVVIKKITVFFSWLNYYFEYSLIYRGLLAVKTASGGSCILSGFTITEYRDYWQGSIIMRFIGLITSGVFAAAGYSVRLVRRANETSLNLQVFRYYVATVKSNGKFWVFCRRTVAECAPIRLARWFFGTCDGFLKPLYMVFLMGALVVPSHMWSNMLLLLSAIFFAAVFALKWFLSEERPKPNFSQISPALVLFVFFCALSIFTGYGGTDSIRVFVIFFGCVIHSVLVSLVFKQKEDLRLFFMIVAAALVVLALFGFYQFAMGLEIRAELTDLGANPGISRLYSTLGNPNNDAQAWAMLLPFVIAVCVTVKCDTKRLILLGIITVVIAAFAMTYSRAGYVALMAGVGVFVLMSAPRLVPVALLALVLALPFVPAGILDRLFTLGQDTSSQYRFWIWEGVLRMLEDFWVQGIGMGPVAFVRIYQGYAHPAAERALHSHNQFLDILSHSGIGALLAFIAYLFRLFKRGISAHIAAADREFKIYMASAVAALTVFVVFGVGEYVWFHPRVMLVFWVIAGICAAAAKLPTTENAGK